jgi:hypothetical protein
MCEPYEMVELSHVFLPLTVLCFGSMLVLLCLQAAGLGRCCCCHTAEQQSHSTAAGAAAAGRSSAADCCMLQALRAAKTAAAAGRESDAGTGGRAD